MWLLWLLLGCAGGRGECDSEAECGGKCPPPPSSLVVAPDPADPSRPLTLDDHEWAIFGPLLQDMRAGARPLGEKGLGWCADAACASFLPRGASTLPAGRWQLRATLAVPESRGHSFHGRFEHTCALSGMTEDGEKRTQDQSEKDLEVRAEPGREGVALDALVEVVSPDPQWHRTCAWELSFENPRGTDVWSGRYEVPSEVELKAGATPPAD